MGRLRRFKCRGSIIAVFADVVSRKRRLRPRPRPRAPRPAPPYFTPDRVCFKIYTTPANTRAFRIFIPE